MKIKMVAAIRWCARILGLGLVIIVVGFVIGSVMEGSGKPAPDFSLYTLLTFITWGVGLAGLLLALGWERAGVIIATISLLIFNLMAFFNPQPDASYSAVLVLFLVPSGLYLICWWLEKNAARISR